MNGAAGGVVSVPVGAIAIRLAVTSDIQRHIRTAIGPWLLLAEECWSPSEGGRRSRSYAGRV
jgi:hypothetical protein